MVVELKKTAHPGSFCFTTSAQSQGAPGEQLVLEHPQWKLK